MEDGHAKTVEEVLNYFSTDPERGLTLDQVKQNQSKYGPNGKLKVTRFQNTSPNSNIKHQGIHRKKANRRNE